MRVATVLLAVSFVMLMPLEVFSQSNERVRFRPTILAGAELPPAGEKVELKVTLDGITDVQTRLRVSILLDETFEEQLLEPISFDDRRRPIFSTTLYAPRAELRYRFEAQERDGTVHSSREFVSRRDCVESIDLIEPAEILTTASTPSELIALQMKVATRLEHEVQLLENAIELVAALERELP